MRQGPKKIEGLLLSLVETHSGSAIGDLLLRSGKRVPLHFYGVRAKKLFNALRLNPGEGLEATYVPSSRGVSEGPHAVREFSVLYRPAFIRHHYLAYGEMCAWLKQVRFMAQESNFPEEDDLHDRELFQLITKAIQRLDQGPEDYTFVGAQFFATLVAISGRMPQLQICLHCGSAVTEKNFNHFDFSAMGVVCEHCATTPTHFAQRIIVHPHHLQMREHGPWLRGFYGELARLLTQ
jgi:hypothetical protein